MSATSLPSRTEGMVPSTGELTSRAPLASTCGASSRIVIGWIVLISINSLPLTGRLQKSVLAVENAAHAVILGDDRQDRFAGLGDGARMGAASQVFPSASTLAVRRSQAMTEWPCSTSRRAMAPPIRPSPTNPIFMGYPPRPRFCRTARMQHGIRPETRARTRASFRRWQSSQHPPRRTSETKDTSNAMIPVPLSICSS